MSVFERAINAISVMGCHSEPNQQILKTLYSLIVYMNLCACRSMCKCGYADGGQYLVSSSIPPLPSFFSVLKQDLLLCSELRFNDMHDRPLSQGPSCLCLLSPGIIDPHHYTHLFTCVLGKDYRYPCLQSALCLLTYLPSSTLSPEP